MPTPDGMSLPAHRLLAVTALMSTYWLTQAIPIAITSLLPLVLFPLLVIQDAKSVSKSYITDNTFLFLGGFIIALGIEKWGLHERMALHIVRLLGTSVKRVILGFMVATAFLSMWISNTASTLLMTPIALALVIAIQTAHHKATGDQSPVPAKLDRQGPFGPFGVALMLGICWSASIGGLTTLVGTVTNVQFTQLWESSFPEGPQMSAGNWLAAFGPVGLVMLILAWGLLVFKLKTPDSANIERKFFTDRLKQLGAPGRAEWLMLAVFATTACLWTFRKPLQFGDATLTAGWGSWIVSFMIDKLGADPEFAENAIRDSTVAIFMVIVMFLIPSGKKDENECRTYLMDWETAVRLPWSILLLVGGGFAIAGAFEATGLATWMGDAMAVTVDGWPVWALVASTCLLLTFLTEFATNVVMLTVLLPVLAKVALKLEVDPRLLMMPAAVSASCAFMLPIATPPNAIVFSSGAITMGDMARKGILLNIVGVITITLATIFYLVPKLDMQTDSLPDWAKSQQVEINQAK
jgi:solute carrier family 13 (sodium-dependent dicarboxylate transporter), member 2/3/5